MGKENINLSENFQALLQHLYGIKYHQFSGLKENSEWKKTLLKIVNSIQRSIEITIEVIDMEHKKRLKDECEELKNNIKNAKTIDQINEKVILGLIKLVFYLIGERPNHLKMYNTNHSKSWKLNSQRQILYIQSNEQKFKRIIEAAESENYNNSNGYNRNFLFRQLNTFHRDYCKFIEWHKSEYPNEHLKLF